MATLKRESSAANLEAPPAGKRTKTDMSETPTEEPSQAASEETVLGDAETERYRSIVLDSEIASNEVYENILSILESPSLARRVKEVQLLLDGWSTGRRSTKFRPYEARAEAEIRAESIFKRLIAQQQWRPQDAERLLSALMHKDSEALIAISLPMLPNAEHLTIGEVKHFLPKAIDLDGTAALASAIAVTHLRVKPRSAFLDDSNYSDYSFELFQTYAKLSRLTHIAMSGIGGIFVEDSGSYTDIPKYASPVRNIIVKRSQMGTDCLSRVIKFARKDQLESFTYQTGGMISPDTSGAIIDFQLIWAALTHHSSTLKKLDLDLDSQIMRDHPTHYPGDSEGEEHSDSDVIVLELLPFQHLACLRIGIEALLKLMVPPGSSVRLIDVLPPGLEELTIRGYDKDNARKEVKSQLEGVKEGTGKGRLSNLTILEGIDELIPNGEDEKHEDEWEDDGEIDGDGIWK